MRKILLAITLVIFSSTNAFPDPSPGVRWLMREPVTLFDWGLFKAEKDFSKEVKGNQIKGLADFLKISNKIDLPPDFSFVEDMTLSSSSVNYDFAKNKLAFRTYYDASPKNLKVPTQEQNAENTSSGPLLNPDLCKTLLKATHERVDTYLIIGIQTNAWFNHKGFRPTNRPESIEKEIMGISELGVTVRIHRGEHFQAIYCSMPLGGGPVSFKRHK